MSQSSDLLLPNNYKYFTRSKNNLNYDISNINFNGKDDTVCKLKINPNLLFLLLQFSIKLSVIIFHI